jgi:hypothetical protein
MAANKVTAVHGTLEFSMLRLGAALTNRTAFFALPRFRARTGQPSADVQADKIPSRITGC